jgi:integrase
MLPGDPEDTSMQDDRANGADKFEWDSELPGFGLRTRNGKRTWIIQYRIGGKQRRLKIGSGVLTRAQAREAARKKLAQVELGNDPGANRKQERKDAKLTFKAVVADYLEVKKAAVKRRTHYELDHYLNSSLASLHGLPLNAIKRAEIAAELRKIARTSGASSAARARAALSTFFGWCMGEGLVETNPVVGTNKPAENGPRDRVLADEELTAIWRAVPQDADYGNVIKLLILTGCRRVEIGGLRWSEIDIDKRIIKLPGERTKNGRAHEIPLSDLACSILQGQPRRDGREYVFGDFGHGFTSWWIGKSMLDEKLAGLKPFVVHDVRRSVATGMANLGVQPHVIECVLNHVSGSRAGVAGVYNRSPYEREVRVALDLWGEHVRALITGGERKVMPLKLPA